jgi:glutamine synthetase
VRYLNELLAAAENLAELKLKAGRGVYRAIDEVNGLIDELVDALDVLVAQNAELGGDDVHSKAHHMRDNIIPAMTAVRGVCDRLERVLPEDGWPLPRYRDMLFVK